MADPIYAAIEAHREAYAAFEKALDCYAEAGEQDPPTPSAYLRDSPEVDFAEEHNGNGGFTMKSWRTGKLKPLHASYPEQIAQNAPPDLKDAEREAWVLEKYGEWHAQQGRLKEEFLKTQAGKIWAAKNAADDNEAEAQQALFNTAATTVQGLLAYLAYVRDNTHLAECVWAGADDALRLVTTIERAICRIHGLPEPPPWFDETEEAA